MLPGTGYALSICLLALSIPIRQALAAQQYSHTSVTSTRTLTITVWPSAAGTNGPESSIPTATANPEMNDSQSLQSAVLNSTNYYRELHQVEKVVWNDTLADFAADYAKGCIWQHSGGPYGENLASGYPNTTLAIDGWGDEEKDYNYSKKKFSEAVGHFTQLVWSNTTAVGCGLVDCENTGKNGVQGEYLVCEYWPRGNVLGQSGDNVRKKGMAKDGTPGMGGSMRIGRADSVVAALVVVSLLLAAVS